MESKFFLTSLLSVSVPCRRPSAECERNSAQIAQKNCDGPIVRDRVVTAAIDESSSSLTFLQARPTARSNPRLAPDLERRLCSFFFDRTRFRTRQARISVCRCA